MTPLLWILALGVIGAVALLLQRRALDARLAAARRRWGQIRTGPRNMDAAAAYYRARRADHSIADGLDDKTWADLDMDDVFGMLDRTESLVGRQVLYARLRAAPMAPHLDAFEALIAGLSDDVPAREHAQVSLALLHESADAADLIALVEHRAIEPKAWHAVFPLLAAPTALAVLALWIWPQALFVIVAVVLVNLALRGTVAHDLRMAGRGFRQINPLLATADRLSVCDRPATSALTRSLSTEVAPLAKLRRVAAWAGRDTSAAVSGDLGALVLEYFNMMFCLDGNALFFGARHLKALAPELLRIAAAVGEVDAALSVASYRSSVPVWTRPTLSEPGGSLEVSDVRHPLVPEAVPNSFTFVPPYGAIITGSNMSGKTTFLRTVGVTAVMAQTINTCVAREYRAPLVTVRTCIGRADDPASGKSYYLVEVDSVVDLLAAARTATPHLLLFDELFRGTNTVERIAAGEAVLASLISHDSGDHAAHVVLAATHDQELVDLLRGRYQALHFSETAGEDGLAFDYRLRPGPATTRNAIALLRIRGAAPSLIEDALARARDLDVRRERATSQLAES
ncbi:MAG: hypothetical protein ABI634_11820 [Acidobacteriota bacterium]